MELLEGNSRSFRRAFAYSSQRNAPCLAFIKISGADHSTISDGIQKPWAVMSSSSETCPFADIN